MAKDAALRGAGLLGMIGALVSLVAIAAAGDTPDPHESPMAMAAYFTQHRDRILSFAPAGYVGAAAIAAFVLILASRLRAAGQRIASTVVVLGGVSAAAYLALIQVAYTAIAYNVRASTQAVSALFLSTILAAPAWGLAVSLLLLAVAHATWRAGVFPRWHLSLSVAGGLLSGMALAAHGNSGFFSPDVQQQYVANVLILWLLVTGAAVGLRLSKPPGERGDERAEAPGP